ncbi:MAG: hypothetical protein NC548_06480 [Lachnospiraceae bacterium]|nr:hypothetical protein [Lachnospiraceae bacterium]
MSEQYYIRFGKIPEDEVSTIRYHGILVGTEIGVSCYYGVEIDGVWHVVFPNPSNCNTIDTLQCFVGGEGPGAPSDSLVAYVITGDKVGIGCDGEPLVKNVKIIKDISGQFTYLSKYDKAYEMANQIDPETGKSMYDLGFDNYLADEAKRKKENENV